MSKLAPPNDIDKPLFVYGSLKPGELAHSQIEAYVRKTEPDAFLENSVLRTRDGLPIAVQGEGRAPGTLLWFREPDSAYEAVCLYEPRDLYRWEISDIQTPSGNVSSNVLLPRRPGRGADDHELDLGYSSALDPVLGHGLCVVSGLAQEAGECRPVDLGESWGFSGPFFRSQAAFLLAWSVAERFSALAFGPALDPMQRIRELADRPSFIPALKKARVRTGQRVLDSRDLKKVEVGADGSGAWELWYQVRSNMSHRGKGANRDAKIVSEALVDLHDVLRVMIRGEVPDIERQWQDAEPDGVDEAWLLRRRFSWARRQ